MQAFGWGHGRGAALSVVVMLWTGGVGLFGCGSDDGSQTAGQAGLMNAVMSPAPSGATCCPDGNCLCRGADPTTESATAPGPYAVESYTDGFRNGQKFLAATIYYPTDAQPPFAGLVLCPGFTALQNSIAGWGPFLASHGIVLMTIDTNTPNDPVGARDDALLDALASLKAEHTRMDSPLFGKLSADRFGVGGWSMGGGGTWLAAASTPSLKSAMTLAGHHTTGGGPMIAAGITVPTIMFAGETDPEILGGNMQSQQAYEQIPETTPKILYEMAGLGHFAWGNPTGTNMGALGRYGLAFQKLFLEGDQRYKPLLLVEGPGASDWRSTLQ